MTLDTMSGASYSIFMNKLLTILAHIDITGQSFGCAPVDVVELLRIGAIVRATDYRSSSYDVTERGNAFLTSGILPSGKECEIGAVSVAFIGCGKVVKQRCYTRPQGSCFT